MFAYSFKIITNFLFVCQSVSWLTSLLKFGENRDSMSVILLVAYFLTEIRQYRDIFCPGWDIFLKFFWDIPGMFLHYFPIISNILLVCQSFIWLTSVLTLGQYRYISWKIYLSESFWRHSWDIFSLHLCPLGKFDMEHPWTQASEIRKNQLGRSCGAHVWAVKVPSFCYFCCIYASTRLKCWVNMVLRHMCIECLLFRAMPGPCLDYVGTMFGLALLPDQLELCNLEDWIKMV